MITSRAWAGKRYAVLGLARSGAATVAALVASGAEVVAWDDSEERRVALLLHRESGGGGPAQLVKGVGGQPSDPLRHAPAARATSPASAVEEQLVVAPLDDLSGFDALVLSPGVPLNTHPLAARARAQGVPIIGDIELFAQARSGLPPHKVVGITGTNGKSTTTALIHHILQTAGVPSLMGGNIGLPILAQESLPAGGVYVLELSSYQLDLTQSLDCDVAVLTNITPDHLDRYDGFEAYAASKARLFEMQSAASRVVVVSPDEASQGVAYRFADRLFPTSIVSWSADGVSVAEGFYSLRDAARSYDPTHLFVLGQNASRQDAWPSLQGPHNAANVVATAAVVELLGKVGRSFRKLHDALRTYPGLPHRMQRVAEKAGVLYVNDSKATNATAAAPALAAYPPNPEPRVHWILGGRAKTDELDECAPHFDHVRAGYTIGEAGPLFARILRAADTPVTESGTLTQAVRDAAAAARQGETVLLSPACASFDQFRDFEARGDAFVQAVEALP